MPGPWGPAAAITPACVVAVPLGSSTRDLLTSGSPLEEAEVVLEVAGVGVALAAMTAAAGSSGPTSHTRVTTTGVDELAWAARSCRGLVRAGGGEEGEVTWESMEDQHRFSSTHRAQSTRQGPGSRLLAPPSAWLLPAQCQPSPLL